MDTADLNRLRWRCTHRALREMDVLLGGFLDNEFASLSPEQQERLFEPFTRFSEHGNGLGLWICYQIVTQLNGLIRAESEASLTRFVVNLPLDSNADPDLPSNLPH